MGDVIVVQPKTVKGEYRNTKYEVRYDAVSKKWRWHFDKPLSVPFDGEASKLHIAEREVKRNIDKVLET